MKNRRFSSAFTLIETLAVMGVIATLLGLSGIAVSAVSKSNRLNGAIGDVMGTLEQARQYAIGQNTYVWVAFYSDSTIPNSPLTVSVLASKNGVDPTPWSDYGMVPNNRITMLSRIRSIDGIKLRDSGSFNNQIKSLSPLDGGNDLSQGTSKFQIALPGQTSPVTFDRVLQFTPSGECRNALNPIDLVEFGLQQVTGTTPDELNVAAIRVNGFTGQAFVYRP